VGKPWLCLPSFSILLPPIDCDTGIQITFPTSLTLLYLISSLWRLPKYVTEVTMLLGCPSPSIQNSERNRASPYVVVCDFENSRVTINVRIALHCAQNSIIYRFMPFGRNEKATAATTMSRNGERPKNVLPTSPCPKAHTHRHIKAPLRPPFLSLPQPITTRKKLPKVDDHRRMTRLRS
jgi:hypothetical protein